MALFTEISMDDYAKINARNQRNAAEKAAQRLQQKQAGLQAAQNKKTKTSLESALSGLVSGIGERIGDIGSTLNNIGKTVVGGVNNSIQNLGLKQTQKDDSARRNKIAKKYGFNSYAEAINSDKVGDDFWNEIKQSNAKTKENLKTWADVNKKGSIGDVTNVNTNIAKGQALNTIDSVLGVIPAGVGGVVANVGGGAISGIGDEYKRAGREGGNFNLENALKNAAVGGASGLAGSAGASGLSKVANKYGGNAVGKALGSNLASGISGGASAGAIGGALGTALNGGSLEDSLAAALEGAKAGGIGGGAMAGAMGLGGTTLDKIRNRGTTAQAIEPVDAETVQKNRIEAPTAERIPSTVEAVVPTNNRRGIAITDLDAGEQNVRVRNANNKTSRGKYIDGVVKGKNLPEAQGKTFADLGQGENIVKAMNNPESVFGGDEGINFLLDPDMMPQNLRDRLKVATSSYANEFGNPYAAYENVGYRGADGRIVEPITSQESLPKLNRQEYYNDTQGRLKNSGGSITAEDIPNYMQNHLRNDAGKGSNYNFDNETIMREIFGDNMSKDDMYALYDEIASIEPQRAKYTTENAAGALAMDDSLRQDVENHFVNETWPTRKINIESALTQAQPVDIADMATNYRRSTIPARQYEQAIKTMPEAEITAPKTMATRETQPVIEAEPTVDYQTQIARNRAQVAADKAKREAIGGVMQQYGTTRLSDRIEGLPKAIEDMLELGLYDRAEIDNFAKQMSGADSEVAKTIRRALNEAAPVDGGMGFEWQEIFDAAGVSANKNVQKQIQSFIDGQAKKFLHADNNGLYNRNDVYDFGKALEKEGYQKYDRGVRNQNTNTQDYGDALILASQSILNKATDGVDISGKLNTQKIKNILPNNKAWAKKVDNLAANAKTIQDLRSSMSSATKLNLLRQAEEYNMNTYGQNVGGKGTTASVKNAAKSLITGKPLAAVGAVTEAVAEASAGSDKTRNKAIKKAYENSQKLQAQANGETPIKTGKLARVKEKIAGIKDAGIVQGAKNLGNNLVDRANNATASLNNESLANFSLAGMNTLGDQARQFANKQMGKAEAERSQDRLENARTLANAQNEYANALADYNAQEANYNAQMAQPQASSMGSQLDRIASAMELALNAGDITAYGQLADLYKQAAEIEELRNPTKTTEAKALSTSQSKALAAQQQLEALAQMTPDAGTVASGIPLLGGLVDLAGGNEYASQADALATTLGYMLSGANIKEEEKASIYKDYVPTAFDSEAVRQQKLNNARQLIQSYMSDTSALGA